MKVGDPGKIAELHAGLAFQEANLKNVPSLHREERAILAGEIARPRIRLREPNPEAEQ